MFSLSGAKAWLFNRKALIILKQASFYFLLFFILMATNAFKVMRSFLFSDTRRYSKSAMKRSISPRRSRDSSSEILSRSSPTSEVSQA